MSARSSAPELALVLLGVVSTACGGSKKADGDPEKVKELAGKFLKNIPMPAALPECTPADLTGTFPLTEMTAVKLAKMPMPKEVEFADWTNPSELDFPTAWVLADESSPAATKREAAGELLAGKGFVMYHIDLVDIPIAVGVKELKRGYAGYRAIRYDTKGKATCVQVFAVKNSKKVAEWAQDQVEKASIVEPAVARAVQDDFRAQLKATIASLGLPRPADMP
jgi:hypothetical protein